MLLESFAEEREMSCCSIALAVLGLFRSRSKASTLSCIFFEMTGSIDRANDLQGPGFVNCKCFGESKVPRDETGVHEREGWAWVGWSVHAKKVECTRGKVGPG